MSNLKPIRNWSLKHAGMIFLLGGLEQTTKALRMGDGFEDTEGLQMLQQRAQGLVDAIQTRLEMEERE